MASLQYSHSDLSGAFPTSSSDEHTFATILSYNASREIPLQTLYTLNSTPRAQPLPNRDGTRMSSTSNSPSNPVFAERHQNSSAAQAFHDDMSLQISHLPSQPPSMPSSFFTSFLRRCFPLDLVCVDFPRALTGLDYFKELEARRRKKVAYALSRTAIDQAVLDNELQLHEQNLSVSRWVRHVNDKERIIQSLYVQLYIGLRRWIFINELSLMPFNKQNCVAMLNTLFPPIASVSPTANLAQYIAQKQRDDFFKKIVLVEHNGPQVLSSVQQQAVAGGDENGWAPVARQLREYLHLTTSIMSECCNIQHLEGLVPHKHVSGKGGKSNIGTSTPLSGFDKVPAISGTAATSPTEPYRPKTSPGARGTESDKLARWFESFGRSRMNVAEPSSKADVFTGSSQKQHQTIRKIRSIGKLSLKI